MTSEMVGGATSRCGPIEWVFNESLFISPTPWVFFLQLASFAVGGLMALEFSAVIQRVVVGIEAQLLAAVEAVAHLLVSSNCSGHFRRPLS